MEYAELVRRQRQFFESGSTRPVEFRLCQLQRLRAGIRRHESSLLAALRKDLGKSPFQGYTTELGFLDAEICHTLRNLRRWTAPTKAGTPWFVAPARAWVNPEPFGVALIVGPWNYPVQLLLGPLVSAIAAGNCALLKPSEFAPNAAQAVENLVRDSFDQAMVAVVQGGPEVSEGLLQEKYDKIFFTGSTRVGRLVMAAAAKNLTPATLELGGKCPVIICNDADLELAARRIAWGKFMNAGQTCVAPDFVLLPRGKRDVFTEKLQKALTSFYGDDAGKSSDYGRIISIRHFQRLTKLMQEGTILYGGQFDEKELFIAPTILGDVPVGSTIMQEEIFGPVLPILEFESLDEALKLLRGRPIPLALYLFTNDRVNEECILSSVRSGGACINDVVSHMLGSKLPFGGLGESGFGRYHGRTGFMTFSHHRTILRRATWADLPFRYPPQKATLAKLRKALSLLLRS